MLSLLLPLLLVHSRIPWPRSRPRLSQLIFLSLDREVKPPVALPFVFSPQPDRLPDFSGVTNVHTSVRLGVDVSDLNYSKDVKSRGHRVGKFDEPWGRQGFLPVHEEGLHIKFPPGCFVDFVDEIR